MISSFISSIDFLSTFESIKFNKNSRFQSFFGGIISLIIILFSSAMTFYISLDIFLKNEPKTVNSLELMKDLDNVYFSNRDIEFFFALKFANSTAYIDDSIFTIRASQIESQNNFTENGLVTTSYEKEINLKLCSDLYNQNDIADLNINFPLEKYFCIPSDQVKLKGHIGSQIFHSLKIYVEKCKNRTIENQLENDINYSNFTSLINQTKTSLNNNLSIHSTNETFSEKLQNGFNEKICKPIEDINYYLNQGYIHILSSDYLINEKNYNQPLIKYLNDVSDIISDEQTGLNYIIYYHELEFENDNGLIFDNTERINVFKIFNIKNSFDFSNDNKIAFIQIELANNMNVYNRTYPKIQDVLTKLGGFINGINIIGYMLYYFYFRAFRIIDLIIENHFQALNLTLRKTYLTDVSNFMMNAKYNVENVKKNFDVSDYNEGSIVNNFNNNSNSQNIMIITNKRKNVQFENFKINGEQINIEKKDGFEFENKSNKNKECFKDKNNRRKFVKSYFFENEISDHLKRNIKISKEDQSYDSLKGQNSMKLNNFNETLFQKNKENNLMRTNSFGLNLRKDRNSLNDSFIESENKENNNDINDIIKINKSINLSNQRINTETNLINCVSKENHKPKLIKNESSENQINSSKRESVVISSLNTNSKKKTIKDIGLPVNKSVTSEINFKKKENIEMNKTKNHDIKIISNKLLELSINNEINEHLSNKDSLEIIENQVNLKGAEIQHQISNYKRDFNQDKEFYNLKSNNKNFNLDANNCSQIPSNQKFSLNHLKSKGSNIINPELFNFTIKKTLFSTYWCKSKNKKLQKLLNNKEDIINNYLSIENLIRISYDVKFLKYFFLDEEKENIIDKFYQYSILDDENINTIKLLVFAEKYNLKNNYFEIFQKTKKLCNQQNKHDKIIFLRDLLKFD